MTYRRDAAQILSSFHWVFDLDGTLTLPIHDFSLIRNTLGVPKGTDILAHLAGLPPEEAQPLHDALLRIEMELLDRIEPAPGMVGLIETLHQRGTRLGILTRNTRDIALQTLQRLGVAGYFEIDDIIGRHDAPPKPDPDGLLMLSARWKTVPEAMVIVGDYVFDLLTGRNAGVATIHVDLNRNFPWPELTDIGVGTLEELLALLPA